MAEIFQAVYPGAHAYPSANIYPGVPGTTSSDVRFTGSNGTTVSALAVLDVTESTDSNTLIQPRQTGAHFIDIRPWSPSTLTITCLLSNYETYKHLRMLYASGALVTMHDEGSPWNGLRHMIAGTMAYRALPMNGLPTLLEARIEVVEQ